MKQKKIITLFFICTVFFFFTLTTSAYAGYLDPGSGSSTLTISAYAGYLDPGSGSSFIQGLIAIFAFFGRMIDKLKRIFTLKK